MSGSIAALTVALLALPVGMLWIGWRVEGAGGLVGCALALPVLYAGVWGWCRPSGFEVTGTDLCIRFPARARRLSRNDIRDIRSLSTPELRAELGFAVRIGIGGLWGGFGWVWSRQRGLIELYISRVDGLILVERTGGRPLLITPADPEAFRLALAS